MQDFVKELKGRHTIPYKKTRLTDNSTQETQKTIKIFIKEIYSKPPKQNYATNKTDVYHDDDIWSLNILDKKDYVPENNRGYRYVLVMIESFSKFGWTVPLKNKNAQTIKDSFEKIFISSKRKQNLIETGRGKEIYLKNFENFLDNDNIKPYSKNSSFGSVYVEHFNRTIRNLLKRPAFERDEANWIDILPTITKQYNVREHSSNKLTPIQASLQKTEEFVYNNLLDKRKKINPKFQVNVLLRVADFKKNVLKR